MNRLSKAVALVVPAALVCALAVSVGGPGATAAQPSTGGPSNSMPSAAPSAITPAVNDGRVFAIAQTGNTMVIGGSFTSVGGNSHTKVAAFDKNTGALSSAFAPDVNDDVNMVIPGPTSNTVYIGGAFTQVNGIAAQFLALLDLSTGGLVTTFKPPSFNYGYVNDLVLRGNRLYVAGTFTKSKGIAHAGLVAVNATTGALDPFMNVQLTGHHNDTGSGAVAYTGGTDMDVTADGRTMVIIGNFKLADGQLRNQVALIDLTGSTAVVAPWATDGYAPLCYNWAFDMYVRGVSFSPDGSYFAINATGGGNPGTLCDATSRFETDLTNSSAQPTWVDQTGGDTTWGITVTNTAVFVGGHNRWENNPGGVDHAQPGAVPRAGLEALDPQTGRPFAWNPGRHPLGVSVFAFLATTDGVWLGSDTDYIGPNYNYYRPKLAFFPYAGGYTPAATSTPGLPATAFLGGSRGGGTTNVLYRVDAGGGEIDALDNGPDWAADNTDPSAYRNNGSNAAGWSAGESVDSTVPATTPSAVFESERWSPSDNPPMDWSFPVAAGTPLQVRLYFANRCGCTSGSGQRVFDVAIDGTTVLDHYDIVANVGDQTGTMKAFPITSDGNVNIDFSHITENPLINGIEIVRTDVTPTQGSTNGLSAVNFDGTTAQASSSDNQGIDFGNWRGSFLVGGKVFYGYTDGYMYSRTFDGTTFGPAQQVNPYHDPVWANVSTGNGDTFDGATPTFYSQLPNVGGMAYYQGRVYYTLHNDPNLYSKWFLPDSGIIDETTFTQSSSVDFSNADGMFIAGGRLYYASRDGVLRSAAFSNGTVSQSPSVVSGPASDGVNWSNRALFLAPAVHHNAAPTARINSQCTGLNCTFDGTSSSDSDGTVTSYAWSFGDGTSVAGATVTHTYAQSGTYTARLTVTDDGAATGAATQPVTVTAPTQTSRVAFVGAADAGGGNVTAKSLTVPAAGHAGDTALLFLSVASTATWNGPTGVTGWNLVGTYSAKNLTTMLWTKTLVAGDPGATLGFSSGAVGHAAASVAVYSGVSTSSPLGAVAALADTSSTTHVTPTTTVGPGGWAVSFLAEKTTAPIAWTLPASQATRDATPDTGTTTIQSVAGDSGAAVTGGTAGGITATSSAAVAAQMLTIPLNSA